MPPILCFTFKISIGGHFGRDKTYEKIASRFYWPNLYFEVSEYITACDICQRINEGGKFVKSRAPLHPIKVGTRSLEDGMYSY